MLRAFVTHGYDGAEARGLPFINAHEKGCVADGYTDNAPILQAIINDLPPGGGKVILPCSSSFYRINSPVVMRNGVTICGAGRGDATRIVNYGNTDAFRADAAVDPTSTRYLQFRDLIIQDGYGAGRTTGHGVNLIGSGLNFVIGCKFKNVTISGHIDGARIQSGYMNRLVLVTCPNNKQDGLHLLGTLTTTDTDTCYFNNNGRYGVHLDGSLGSIAGCHFRATATDTNVSSGWFIDATVNPIYSCHFDVPYSEDCLQDTMVFTGNAGSNASHVITAPHLVTTTAGKNAIRLNNAGRVTIIGGLLTPGAGGAALSFAGTSKRPVIDRTLMTGIEFDVEGLTRRGEFRDRVFDAGHYTASAGAWTVNSGNVEHFSYSLIGPDLMEIEFYIKQTNVTAAPAELRIGIPGGYAAAARSLERIAILDAGAGGWVDGSAEVLAGDTFIRLTKGVNGSGGNWTTTAGSNTYAYGKVRIRLAG